MLDTSAIAADVIFKMKYPDDPLLSTQRRAEFIRTVGKDLMRFQMLRRFQVLVKASRPLRGVMRACLQYMGLPMEEGPATAATTTATETKKRGRCGMSTRRAQ
ncbi:hypothetical protein PoB_004139000 [Plakobranchus ocellatus]|uniref:Uncharacterized protein n=1 Tax=Plakobranchus ocellatus TaxID=259542 RepID=A0AAV4B5I8_9GAST|nr:hypothetical protein PoB_004139000 [Plakobranchus ocellatus]